MKKLYLFLLLLLITAGTVSSEGLFDTAVSDSQQPEDQNDLQSENSTDNKGNPGPEAESDRAEASVLYSGIPVDFSGSVKGLLSSGINREENNFSTGDSFSEFRGEITASPSGRIKAFSEIIVTNTPAEDETVFELREAYIDIYGDLIDFSIGEKIIVWGKADAVNPTNRITPVKSISVSSAEDDRRLGNLLAETRLNLYPFTLTAVWVPVYRQSELPSFIDTELNKPDPVIENSSLALKTDYENSSFDFSLSWFSGFNPTPGISGISSGTRVLKPYRIHNIGFDFSTTLSDYGIRGETAFLLPAEDHEKTYVPSPEISYVAGIDRSIGDFTLILQYSGKYITDFIDENDLSSLTQSEIQAEYLTRIISGQKEQISHSAVFRASADLFYETLSLETAGSYNFTTEELFIKPLIIWDVSDSLTISGGAFLYSGPDATLSGMLEGKAGTVFTEVKLCF